MGILRSLATCAPGLLEPQQPSSSQPQPEQPVGYLLLPRSNCCFSARAHNGRSCLIKCPESPAPCEPSRYSALGTAEPTTRCPLYLGPNFVAGTTACSPCTSNVQCDSNPALVFLPMKQPLSADDRVHGVFLCDSSLSSSTVYAQISLQGQPGHAAKAPLRFGSKYCCHIKALSSFMCYTQSGSATVPLGSEPLAPQEEVEVHSGDFVRVGEVEGRIFFGSMDPSQEASFLHTRVSMPPGSDTPARSRYNNPNAAATRKQVELPRCVGTRGPLPPLKLQPRPAPAAPTAAALTRESGSPCSCSSGGAAAAAAAAASASSSVSPPARGAAAAASAGMEALRSPGAWNSVWPPSRGVVPSTSLATLADVELANRHSSVLLPKAPAGPEPEGPAVLEMVEGTAMERGLLALSDEVGAEEGSSGSGGSSPRGDERDGERDRDSGTSSTSTSSAAGGPGGAAGGGCSSTERGSPETLPWGGTCGFMAPGAGLSFISCPDVQSGGQGQGAGAGGLDMTAVHLVLPGSAATGAASTVVVRLAGAAAVVPRECAGGSLWALVYSSELYRCHPPPPPQYGAYTAAAASASASPFGSDAQQQGRAGAQQAASSPSCAMLSPRSYLSGSGADGCSGGGGGGDEPVIFSWISTRRRLQGMDPLEAWVQQRSGSSLGGMSMAVTLSAVSSMTFSGSGGGGGMEVGGYSSCGAVDRERALAAVVEPPAAWVVAGECKAAEGGGKAVGAGTWMQRTVATQLKLLLPSSSPKVAAAAASGGHRVAAAAAAALDSLRALRERQRLQRQHAATRSAVAGVLAEEDEDV